MRATNENARSTETADRPDNRLPPGALRNSPSSARRRASRSGARFALVSLMENASNGNASIEERIFHLVAEESDTPRETLDRGTALIELGDSLTRVETVMELEDAFEVAIPDEEVDKVRTLGELIDLVDAKVRGRETGGGREDDGHAPPGQ
jgi:acyl carrier protein